MSLKSMRFPVVLAGLLAMGITAPVSAQTYVYEVVVEEWVETSASRFVSPELAHAENRAIASYGPFRVLDANRAALVGVTNSWTPAQFDRMMKDHPGINTLEFIECPGTHDDRANLRLGRMIRESGLDVIVPEGGSVRSGAVELFLAGEQREIADGAEFAVHAWLDERGKGAWDYAPNSPEHRKYLEYYREMGMEQGEAARFYAMTNSVPFESALWLTGEEMRYWVSTTPIQAPEPEFPRLVYLDLGLMLY